MSDHPTIGGERDQTSATSPLVTHPLSQAQAGIWYAQRLDPDNPVFNTAQYVEIRGRLDVEAFVAAVGRTMVEAEALAIRVVDDETGPRQIVDASRRAHLDVVALYGQPLEVALSAIDADLQTPLDPRTDALACQRLFVLSDEHFVWYQRVHHLVIDGYGTALLTSRICDLYSTAVEGTGSGTLPLASFGTVLEADEAYQASAKRDADRAFWTATMDGAPPAPGLARKVGVTATHYRRAAVDLEPGVAAALSRLAEQSGLQWPDVLAALAAAYVARHSGEIDVTVGLAAMERLGTVAARVPAMVMNIVPLRILVDEDRPLVEWLQSLAPHLRRMRRHGRYRGEHLRRDLGLLGGDRRLYGVLVNVLPFDAPPGLAGVTADLHVLATGPVDDLTFNLRGDATLTRLRAELDANPRLYTQAELEAHARRFAAFAARAVSAERLHLVPTVTDAEREQLVSRFNDTRHEVPRSTLDRLVRDACSQFASRPALQFGADTLTYAQLDADVERLARGLRAVGVMRGDVVGVALDRSLDLIPVIYAAIRVGAAYLPLDTSQPASRLRRLLDIAAPRVVIAAASTMPDGVADERWLTTAQLRTASDGHDEESTPPAPDDAAYVIFTSGSTGEPKGVVVEHAAIVNRLLWMRDHYGIGPSDVLVQKTPTTFDVSVWELFLAALSGATLVVAEPGSHRDPRAMARLLRERGVTIAHFVPSMLAEILDEPSAVTGSLRAVFCSGEALPAALRDRFHRRLDAALHNLYGPTEAAVDVTYWPADRDDHSDPVPIGWPVWNTSLHVLDDRRRLVPIGVAGHLYLGGVQLARGYLGRADLTEERFVASPFGPEGQKLYQTGDIARWRPDGAVEYLGRSDYQVKVRGQRIELGEIEAALMASGLAERAVVIARDVRGATTLVGYVQVAAAHTPFDALALREAVASRVPEAMVPAAFVEINEWPVTANGKLDQRNLPLPAGPSLTGPVPHSDTQRRVATCFAEVLGLDVGAITTDTDFFAVGGHSLAAAQATRLLRQTFGDESIELSALFQHPTVASLAAHLDDTTHSPGHGAVGDSAPIIRLRDGRRDVPVLACIHPAGGLSWCYLPLARALAADRAVFGFQARGLVDTSLPASLDDLADDYARQLTAIQPTGPYDLLGWSIGGIIAQAMAVRLEAMGKRVRLLAMLDSYPSDRWRTGTDATEAMALRALLLMAGEHPDETQLLTRKTVLQRLRASDHPLGLLSDETLSGVLRVVQHNNRLVRRHEHTACAAPLVHFMADREHAGQSTSPAEWAPYVGRVEVHHLDVLHAHMTAPASVRLIADVLERISNHEHVDAR